MSGLYLGAVHFDGDPDVLLPGYRRLSERFPIETLDLHVSVRRDDGITIYDACPTREIFDDFTTGETFLGAVAEAGLPVPRVEGLGDVQVAHVREEARR